MLTRGSSGRRGVASVAGVSTFVTVLVASVLSGSAHADDPATAPVRVLAVGDSITQGHAGEYTWRRFAWQEWRRQGVAIDMVGPRRAPYVAPDVVGPATYADAGFDQDHAGIWGARVSYLPAHDVGALVTEHQPDVLVLALGTNDLVWLSVAPETVVQALDWRIYAARLARPGIDVVLPEVVAPRTEVTAQHNALLRRLAADRDTPDMRVTVANTSSGFVPGTGRDRGGDTYDPLHPDSVGQAKYGAAVVDAFARIGIGRSQPRPLSLPVEGLRGRPALRASGGPARIDLRWSRPAGTTSMDVLVRRPGQAWRTVSRERPFDAASAEGLRNCRTYEVTVAARRGWNRAASDRWATPVRLKAGGTVVRPIVTAVKRTSRTVRVRWAKDPSACSYRVTVKVSGRKSRNFTTTKVRTVVGSVPAGARVTVKIRAVGAKGKSRARVIRVLRD